MQWRSFSLTSVVFSLIVSALFAMTTTGNAYATETEMPPAMPLEDQEKLQQLHNQIRALEFLKTGIREESLKKNNECMKAIGVKPFCECIGDKSPGSINFAEYVAYVSATKEELQYDTLSETGKKIVDAARLARDKCVNSSEKPAN